MVSKSSAGRVVQGSGDLFGGSADRNGLSIEWSQ